jgi:hypothetical protein
MKFFKTVTLVFLIPVLSFAQAVKPGNLHGTLVIEEKPVEFTYLSTPDGKTDLPYFRNLPTKLEYLSSQGKEFLPLQEVVHINILRFSDEELQSLYESCDDCILYKAVVTFNTHSGYDEETIYLALNYLTWENSNIQGFDGPHHAELRFLEAVMMNKKIE